MYIACQSGKQLKRNVLDKLEGDWADVRVSSQSLKPVGHGAKNSYFCERWLLF